MQETFNPSPELERTRRVMDEATSFGEPHQPGFQKVVIEALLQPGSSVADTLMRGALEPEQIAPAVRCIVRDLWLQRTRGGTVPKGLEDLVEMPHSTAVVALTGILQAAAQGKARAQTLTGLTGGMAAMGMSGADGLRRRVRRLFGRNGSGAELTA